MIYKEAIDYIKNIERAGSDFGIERMRELLILLGEPDRELRFIHIAGTNGKGSVSAYITSILRCAGYKVGTYNSPSVFDYNERFLIAGQPISDEEVALYLTTVKDAIEKEQKRRKDFQIEQKFSPTAFEIETAVAFLCFYAEQCDVCVLETGLGGRWDATNVIYNKELAVITPIGLDHCGLLGNTLSEIAAEKAAISHEIIVTVNQNYEIMQELKHPYKLVNGEKLPISNMVIVAEKPEFISGDIEGQKFRYEGREYEISMLGKHQIENASLAICAVKSLCRCCWDIPNYAIQKGLKETEWHGRLEIVKDANEKFGISVPESKVLVFDGSHNPHGAKTLADGIKEYFSDKRVCLVLGILSDKDVDGIVKILCPLANEVYTVTPPSPRALDKMLLKEKIEKICSNAEVSDSIKGAIKKGFETNDVVVLCGSLTLFEGLGDRNASR